MRSRSGHAPWPGAYPAPPTGWFWDQALFPGPLRCLPSADLSLVVLSRLRPSGRGRPHRRDIAQRGSQDIERTLNEEGRKPAAHPLGAERSAAAAAR
ncbi:hypothetical protein ACGFZK_03660 [Streptomyces sp. NPDC048257]|uniref:hypothetical protein n=1 Tax=Streptomyces sp. NPDC048257 TaxID=3365526 RepID=UPI0037169795